MFQPKAEFGLPIAIAFKDGLPFLRSLGVIPRRFHGFQLQPDLFACGGKILILRVQSQRPELPLDFDLAGDLGVCVGTFEGRRCEALGFLCLDPQVLRPLQRL